MNDREESQERGLVSMLRLVSKLQQMFADESKVFERTNDDQGASYIDKKALQIMVS